MAIWKDIKTGKLIDDKKHIDFVEISWGDVLRKLEGEKKRCPECKALIEYETPFCPYCYIKLKWEVV